MVKSVSVAARGAIGGVRSGRGPQRLKRLALLGSTALIGSAVLIGATPAAAQTATPLSQVGFEDGSLVGWNTFGHVETLASDSVTVNLNAQIGGAPNNVVYATSALGNFMVRIDPTGATSNSAAVATALGFSSNVFAANTSSAYPVTNVGALTQSVTLAAGNYSFGWSYAALDYAPYNDSTFFSLTGNGVSNLSLLSANVSSPQPDTLIVGSYGSTPWRLFEFNIANAGTYQLGFGDFNVKDTGYNPILYIDSGIGGLKANNVVVPPAAPPVVTPDIDTATSTYTVAQLQAASVNPTFAGGKLTADTTTSIANNFTVAAPGGTIDTAGHTLTLTGTLSDASGASGGITKAGAGTLVLTTASTRTGDTYITGGTLQLNNLTGAGTGKIHLVDPTIALGVAGTNSNDYLLDVGAAGSNGGVGGAADHNVFQNNSGGTVTLTGSIRTGTGTNSLNQMIDPVQYVDFAGGGTFELANATGNPNSWTGATTIASGTTLRGTTATISGGNAAGGIIDNGVLEYNQATGGVSALNISGTGVVNITGTGFVTLTGAITNAGTVNLSGFDSRLQIAGTRSGSTGAADGGFGSAVLISNRAALYVTQGAQIQGGNFIGVRLNDGGTGSSVFNNGSITNTGTGGTDAVGAGIAIYNATGGNSIVNGGPSNTAAIISGSNNAINRRASSNSATTVENYGTLAAERYNAIETGGGTGTLIVLNNGSAATIVGRGTAGQGRGISHGSTGQLRVDNTGGRIVGSTEGIFSNGVVTITNSGTIASGTLAAQTSGALTNSGGNAITANAGGTITNQAGGIISGSFEDSGTGMTDNAIQGNAALTVINSGQILGVAVGSASTNRNYGVYVQGGVGTITNNSSGLILGGWDGVFLTGGGSAANSGTIAGNIFFGVENATSINNAAGGRLIGPSAGARIAAGGSVTNAGLIVAGSYNSATDVVTNGATGSGLTMANGTVTNNAGGRIVGGTDASNTFGIAAGGALTLTANAGKIVGGYAGLQATGVSSITNSGLIASGTLDLANAGTGVTDGYTQGGTDGIRLLGGGSVTNNAGGQIRGATSAVQGSGIYTESATGAAFSVSNSGTITGSNGVFSFGGNGQTVGVTNNANGVIAATAGVGVNNSASAVTISANAGQIVGTTNAVFAAGAGSNITNSGLIGVGTLSNGSSGTYAQGNVSVAAQGAAILLQNGGTVTNTGTLTGSSDTVAATGRRQAGIAINAGLLTLDNSGAISGGVWGVTAGAGAINATNRAGGTITGTSNNAIYAGGGAGSQITNAGTLTGGNAGVYGDGTGFTVNNSGTIRQIGAPNAAYNTVSSGIYASNTGAQITNSGLIEGTIVNSHAIYLQNAGGVASATITNQLGGIIRQTATTGAAAILANNGVTINNAGTIATAGTSAFDGITALGGLTLTNTGTRDMSGNLTGGIITAPTASGVAFTGAGNIKNSGRIAGGSDASFGYGVQAAGGATGLIDNLAGGSIEGGTGGIVTRGTSLTIDNKGVIRGFGATGTGIRAESNVTIGNAANSSIVGTVGGINVVGGTGTITNSGLIAVGSLTLGTFTPAANGGYGISLQNGSVTNTVAGTIRTGTTGGSGITSAGAITIGNAGIIAGVDQGINDSGVLTLTNSGDIAGGQQGVIASSAGANQITNSGRIVSGSIANTTLGGAATIGGSDALRVAGGTVGNNAGGLIQGQIDGVSGNGAGIVNVNNTGTIRANDYAAIELATAGGTVHNFNGGQIVGGNRNVSATNAGAGVRLNAGGTVINDAGATISGTAATNTLGVVSTGNTVVTNAGTISGTTFAVRVTGTTGTSTITNSGTIASPFVASGNQVQGAAIDTANAAVIMNTGTLSGNNGIQTRGSATIDNFGSITGLGDGNGIALLGGGTATNRVGGTVTATQAVNAWGIYAATVAGSTLTNQGRIDAGVGLVNTGVAATLVNSGTIAGQSAGIEAINAALNATNSGTITATATGALATIAGVRTNRGGSFTNSGSITGVATGVLSSGGALTLTTTGTISGSTRAITATGNFADNVTLGAGSTTSGGINLGDGNDTLAIFQTAAYSGTVDLGTGGNSVNLRGDDTGAAGGAYASGILNVATLSKLDAGDWTATDVNVATVNAGTGLAGQGGTLTLAGTGTITDINVNGAELTLASTTAAGNATIHMIDPTVNFAATGTYNNNFDLAVANGQQAADPSIFNNISNGGIVLAGTLTESVAGQYVTFAGDGTTTLSNAGNLWTGETRVNAGASLIGTTATISGGNIVTDGTLTYDQATDGTIAQQISGSGALVKTGTGTVAITQANGYAGGTTVNGGTLQLQNTTLPGGAVSVASGARLEYNVTGGGVFGDGRYFQDGITLTGAGVVAITGTSNLSWRSDMQMAAGGQLSVESGSFTASSDNLGRWDSNLGDLSVATGALFNTSEAAARFDKLTGTGTVRIDSSGSLTIGVADGTSTFDGTISDQSAPATATTGTLTKVGTGTLTLTGVNTYTGGTIVAAGTLVLAGGQALADSNDVLVNAGGTLAIAASETIGSLNGGGAVELAANTLTVGGNNQNTAYFGVASGTGGITKTGTGTLVLAGQNTFTGELLIAGGTVAYGANDVLADTATVTVNGGTTFDLSGYSDTIGTLNLYGTLANGGALTATSYNAYAGSTIGQTITTGTLNVFGDTTLTAATAASPVNIYAGTLTTTSAELLSDTGAVLIAAPGTLRIGGAETIGSLADLNGGGGNVDLQGNLLSVGGDNTNTTFSGVIGNSGAPANLFTYVGSYAVGDGPDWQTNPAVYSGQSAAALLFGGNAGDYAISTTGMDPTQVKRLAFLDGWGDAQYLFNPQSDSFSVDQGAPGYNDPSGVGTAYSAYVNDHSGPGQYINYVFRASPGVDTNGLTKIGSGTLTLTGVNTYTGLTTVSGGTLALGGGNAIADGNTIQVDAAGTLALNADETIGSLNGSGAVALNANRLTVGFNDLDSNFAGVASGTGGITKLGAGTLTLAGANTYTGATQVQAGTLALGASDVLADTGFVSVASGATFDLGANSDTIGSLALNGTLNGTGTLTADVYTLNGATVNGNLGNRAAANSGLGSVVFQQSGTTLLNGTSAAAQFQVNGGTLVLGASDRLADTTALSVATNGTLDLQAFDDTVGSAAIDGTLNGTGTLTAARYELDGATVNANLGGGLLVVTPFNGRATTLNGTAAATTVQIQGGTLVLGASERLADTANVSVTRNFFSNDRGALNLGAFNETVGTLSITNGSINGTGTLTAASYTLNDAVVNANLGTGTLTANGAASTLNGTSAAGTVNVTGTLNLGASNRLADNAAVTILTGGVLNIGAFNDTIGNLFVGGTLNGTGTITAGTPAGNGANYTLNGGTVNANLGTGILRNVQGASTLNGTSAAATVLVTSGSLALGASNRLADTAAVSVSSGAALNLGANSDTVGSLTLGGTLGGTGTLTAASYTLTGGTANANLGAGTLTQASGTSTLNGTAAANTVNVTGGTLVLGANERLSDAAALAIGADGVLDLGAFAETVGTATIAGGLNGTGTLTAASYTLTGGTVNANLGAGVLTQASGSSTLNGTAAAATVNVTGGTLSLGASNRLADNAALAIASGATFNLAAFNDTVGTATIAGTLAGTGTLTAASYTLDGATVNGNLGTGTLIQRSGSSTLNGTSAASTVNVNAGTLNLGASNRLADAANVAIASGATLNLAANTDTVGVAQIAGTLGGTGTLTASQYQLTGATVNANLGTGTLFQLGGTSTLNGTAAAANVSVQSGVLLLGASERLADAAALLVNSGATLNATNRTETIGTLFNGANGSGTVALGATGRLVVGGTNGDFGFSGTFTGAGDVDKTGTGTFTYAANAGTTARLNVLGGTMLFSGTSGGAVRIAGGTLTGAGTIGTNLSLSSGTLSPGTAAQPIATFTAASLNVSGGNTVFDLAGQAGSYASDLIRVTGAANLTGGTVTTRTTEANGNYQVAQFYTVLQAGSLTGTFANGQSLTAVSNDPNLQYRLRYDLAPNSVVVELRKQIDFGAGLPGGGTDNQRAVAGALNGSAFTASDAYASVLNRIASGTATQRAASLDSISGEAIADIATTSMLAATGFADLLKNRVANSGGDFGATGVGTDGMALNRLGALEKVRAAAGTNGATTLAGDGQGSGVSAWLAGYGSNGTIEGRSGTGSANVNTFYAGAGIGADARFGNVAIGLGAAANRVETNVAARTSKSDGTLYQGGGYLAFDNGATFANVVGSYFEGDIDSKRSLFINGGFFGQATGTAETKGYTAGGAVGHRFMLDRGFRVTPQLSVGATGVKRDAFTETGAGVLNLAVGSEKRDLYQAAGELKLSHRSATTYGWFEPFVSGGVRRSWGDRDATSAMRFTGAPVGVGAFTVAGAELPKLAGLLTGGFDAKVSDKASIGLSAESTLSKRQTEGRVNLNLKIGF